MKKTQWFPSTIKPANVGVYETRLSHKDQKICFQYWDGNEWGFSRMTVDGAYAFAHDRRIKSDFQKVQWRGLREPA